MFRSRRYFVGVSISLLLAAFGACGGDTPIEPLTVGPEGGTFEFANGAVVLVIPAGAVSENVTLSVQTTGGHPGGPTVVSGSVYDLAPDGLQFAVPVQITISYGALALPQGVHADELGLYRVVGSGWEALAGSTVDTATGVLSGSTTRLSVYGILGAPVASVSVSPESTSVQVAETTQLTAAVADSAGGSLPDRVVSWASSDAGVASVDATGLVQGVAPGVTTVIATTEGVSGTADVTITQVITDPPAWFEQDFSSYANDAEFKAATADFANGEFDKTMSQVFLDQAVGFDPLTQSMRNDYIAPGCGSQTVGRMMNLPEPASDLWIELWLMFGDNFTTRNVDGCGTPPDFKTFIGVLQPDGFCRFELHVGGAAGGLNFTVGAAGCANGSQISQTFGDATTVWDGQWHRYRLHWRVGTPNGQNTAVRFWLDDELMFEKLDFDAGGTPIVRGLLMGANLDQGIPSGTMSLWWGRVRAWNSDPGW